MWIQCLSQEDPWRRKEQPFLLENLMDWSLVSYTPWGHKELDTTEVDSTIYI